MQAHNARAELERLVEANRTTLRSLSLMLGRNAAYLQQYVKRGTPAELSEADRRALADFLGVAADVLSETGPLRKGASRSPRSSQPGRGRPDMVVVPRLDVEASAGPGALPSGETPLGHYGFEREWLQRLAADPAKLSILRVKGDSMAPTLIDGDDILVEQLDAGARVRDGIHVLQRDDALLVKRVAIGRAPGKLDVSSDNSAYSNWPNCDVAEVQVLGRVIWSARRQS